MSKGPWKKRGGKAPPVKEAKSTTGGAAPKVPPKEVKPEEKGVQTGQQLIPEVVPIPVEVPGAPPVASEGGDLDLTDEELKDIMALMFQETGNVVLKWLKRQLITDAEGKTFAKMAFPEFKRRLKDKMNIGLAGPCIYTCLVFLSKGLTEEGKKEQAAKKAAAAEKARATSNA